MVQAADAWSTSGRMINAPPLGTVQVTEFPLSQFPICSAVSRPSRCEPAITRNGPLSIPLSSRCSLMARMPLITSAGGCTCKTPAFFVHGPKPLVSLRSRTAIVKSWCQTTFQFELRVLLKKIPLTAKHSGPRTLSTISRTDLDIASARTHGTDNRFLSGYRASSNCLLRSSTVASSKHAATTAKPSRSTSDLNTLVVLTSPQIQYYAWCVGKLFHGPVASMRSTPDMSRSRTSGFGPIPHLQVPRYTFSGKERIFSLKQSVGTLEAAAKLVVDGH
jgi:hypothetical protein